MSYFESKAKSFIKRRYDNAQEFGFRKNVTAALGEWSDIGEWYINFIPDLYQINEKKKTIRIWEIEDTNPLSESKMQKLIKMWFYLDCEDWDFEVITTDRYGLSETVVPVDAYYFDDLMVNAKKAREVAC